ncbi:MAG: IS5/IS1182 family transposase, partial [Deltaproteobacteria bacterium]
MLRKNNTQFTIGEELIYQRLPEDTLSQVSRLID